LTEVLQGLPSDTQARRVEMRLRAFDILRLQDLDDFTRAARLYRTAAANGYTVRKTIDCLIAAVCIREQLPLLHNDADFDRLAEVTPLVVHSPQAPAGPCHGAAPSSVSSARTSPKRSRR
jgi:predicted nucleic acid-binding protein